MAVNDRMGFLPISGTSPKTGFPVTCVGLRLAVQVRRANRSIRSLEPQDVFQAEYTED